MPIPCPCPLKKMDIDQYCRDIEAHLCRRNGGHLVRIAGPAFDVVRGWAQRGIPLKVALQGIDRHVDRSTAKGMRRRPVRVEFCEADVLDAFDAWRRAVGIHRAESEAAGEASGERAEAPTADAPRVRARESLSTHLDRVIVRLTSLRAGDTPAAWGAVIEEFVRTLDAMHPAARRARGEARERVLAEMEALDARLMERGEGRGRGGRARRCRARGKRRTGTVCHAAVAGGVCGRAPSLRKSGPARAAAASDAHPGLTEAS